MTHDKKEAVDAEKVDKFIEYLGLSANVSLACEYAGLPRKTAYRWRANDEVFAAAWAEAQERGTDSLEDEAVRRASQGVQKKKFTGKGDPVIDPRTGEQYIEHDYSDTLLIFMLKARRPDKFKDRTETMLGGIPGKPVETIEIVRHREKRVPAIEERITMNGNGKHGTNGTNGSTNGTH